MKKRSDKRNNKKVTPNKNKVYYLFLRYIIILLFGLWNLSIFYKIFTPLTTHFAGFILNLFSPTTIMGNIILFKSISLELIPACVAGSAYYLLLILILSTPNIEVFKRIKLILISLMSLFILTSLRIVILALIAQTSYFQQFHMLFWYLVSTLFVVIIWISIIKIYKIKSIPIYSDIRYLLSLSKQYR